MCMFYWQMHVLIASRVADVPPTHFVRKISTFPEKYLLAVHKYIMVIPSACIVCWGST